MSVAVDESPLIARTVAPAVKVDSIIFEAFNSATCGWQIWDDWYHGNCCWGCKVLNLCLHSLLDKV